MGKWRRFRDASKKVKFLQQNLKGLSCKGKKSEVTLEELLQERQYKSGHFKERVAERTWPFTSWEHTYSWSKSMLQQRVVRQTDIKVQHSQFRTLKLKKVLAAPKKKQHFDYFDESNSKKTLAFSSKAMGDRGKWNNNFHVLNRKNSLLRSSVY